MELKEGEILRSAIRGKYKSVEDAAELMGLTRRTLYYYFDMAVLEDDFKENVKEKLGIDITQNEAQNVLNEDAAPYLTKRNKLKNHSASQNEGIIYVPVSAQAGYSKRFKDPVFVTQLETVSLPGTKYRGKKTRIFEVDGDSMLDTLKDGQKVIANYVEPEDWQQSPNYYVYVLISDDMITIKRVFRKTEYLWVLISDNEEFYPQTSFESKNLKELWIVKEKLDWDLAPPKKFEIKI